MKNIDYTKIAKGVRKLVQLLNENGFATTDSGDGSHCKEGMDCAVPHPMVVVGLNAAEENLVQESMRLFTLLVSNGLSPARFQVDGQTVIQTTYSPIDGLAFIVISHIGDDDLVWSEEKKCSDI